MKLMQYMGIALALLVVNYNALTAMDLKQKDAPKIYATPDFSQQGNVAFDKDMLVGVDTSVYRFNPDNGQVNSANLNSIPNSPSAIDLANGPYNITVYYNTTNGLVYTIDVNTGTCINRYNPGFLTTPPTTMPIVKNGEEGSFFASVFDLNQNQALYYYQNAIVQGTVIAWPKLEEDEMVNTFLAADGYLYVGTTNSRILAMDVSNTMAIKKTYRSVKDSWINTIYRSNGPQLIIATDNDGISVFDKDTTKLAKRIACTSPRMALAQKAKMLVYLGEQTKTLQVQSLQNLDNKPQPIYTNFSFDPSNTTLFVDSKNRIIVGQKTRVIVAPLVENDEQASKDVINVAQNDVQKLTEKTGTTCVVM